MKLKLIARIVTANNEPQYPDTRTNNDLPDTWVDGRTREQIAQDRLKQNMIKNQGKSTKRRLKRIELGLCIDCGKKLSATDRKSCEECLEKGRIRQQKNRIKKKTDQVCVKCDQPALKGLTVCDRHREEVNQNARNLYTQKKEQQRLECRQCHTPALSNKLLCETHLNNLKRILRKKEEQGTCALLACTRSTVEGETLCKKHQKEPQPCLSCKKELKDNDYGICQECAEFTA